MGRPRLRVAYDHPVRDGVPGQKIVFPFGAESTPRPPRKPKGEARVFVLGVYPSAVHVRWDLPLWAQTAERRAVGALAIADEPTVFWDRQLLECPYGAAGGVTEVAVDRAGIEREVDEALLEHGVVVDHAEREVVWDGGE